MSRRPPAPSQGLDTEAHAPPGPPTTTVAPLQPWNAVQEPEPGPGTFAELAEGLAAADGRGQRVAIVDTGIDSTHPWIADRLVASYAVAADGRLLACAMGDAVGHGTAAAGQLLRLAPQAELLSVRIFDSDQSSSSERLLAALRNLRQLDVQIVNLSLSTMRTALALQIGLALDDLWADDVVCVCARGYHRTGRDFPAHFANTLAVSHAAQPLDRLVFHSRSPVECSAAGVDVAVAWSQGMVRRATGSSYACPLVAGWCARLRSLRPAASPYEIRTLIRALAERQAGGWRPAWMAALDEPRSPP